MNDNQSVQPQVRLDFYESAVLMTTFDGDQVTTYPVSVHDVAQACAGVSLFSGLLPSQTLFWGRQGDKTILGIFVPARRWQVYLADGPNYHLPMPACIFIGVGNAYYVYAVKERIVQWTTSLWHLPCPNVFGKGRICPGNTPFPDCSAGTIQQALELFLEGSRFNGDLAMGKCRAYPDDVRRLWPELAGRPRFPLRQLLPMKATFRDLFAG